MIEVEVLYVIKPNVQAVTSKSAICGKSDIQQYWENSMHWIMIVFNYGKILAVNMSYIHV
jgi:hypothetical protein